MVQAHFMHRSRHFSPQTPNMLQDAPDTCHRMLKIQSQVRRFDRVKNVTASSRLFLKLLLASPSNLNEEITVDPQAVVRNNVKILLHAVQYPMITFSKVGA